MRIRVLLLTLFVCGLLMGSAEFRCSSRTGTLATGNLINRAPEALDSSLRVEVNVSVSGFMQAVDDDGDELIYTLVSSPHLGVVNVTNTTSGAFTYVSSVVGSDSFSFKVNDGQVDSNIATVHIRVSETQVTWRSAKQLASSAPHNVASYAGSACLKMSAATVLMSNQLGGEETDFDPVTPSCVVADPFDSSHLIAEAEGCDLFQSLDSGLSWVDMDLGALFPDRCQGVLIHFNVFVPGLIYIGINGEADNARLIRSFDGANHWHMISAPRYGYFEDIRSTGLDSHGRIMLQARFSRYSTALMGTDWPFGKWIID